MVIDKRAEKAPLITVLVLGYNHERYIERKMRSLATQTIRDFEVVFVDNCSSDATFECGVAILEAFSIPFVAEKTERNLGISAGLNRGLKNYCRTEYYAPASGDDWWDFNNLESRLTVMRANPSYDVVYGNVYVYNELTKEISLAFKNPQPSILTAQAMFSGTPISSHGTLYKYKVIENIGFYDEHSKIEDWEIFLRIVMRFTVGYDHNPTAFYRSNHASNISRDSAYMNEGMEFIYSKYEDVFPAEVARARARSRNESAYNLATHEPSLKNLAHLIQHYQPNVMYTKQVIKCAVNIFRK